MNEVAGGVEHVTVTAYDAYGNVATGYSGTVRFTSNDGQAILPANSTLTNGVGTFDVTLKTAGVDSITATDTVMPGISGTETGLVVTPSTATGLVITGASNGTAGGVQTLTATAYDAYGNVAADYSGTVHVTSSDGQAVLPADVTLTNGVGTFDVTLKTAGTSTITATDIGTPGISGHTSGLTIAAASASAFTFSTDTSGGGRVSITVTARDPFGNVATGYSGTVHLTSNDPNAALPADGPLVGGVGVFEVTFPAGGAKTVTATDRNDGSLSGTDSFNVTRATSQAGTVVASDPEIFYGQDVTLTATFSATQVGSSQMTGTVSFYDGPTFLGTVDLVAVGADGVVIQPSVGPITVYGRARLRTTALNVGNHTIRAVYSGDINYSTATSNTPVQVLVDQTVTSTHLESFITPNGTSLVATVAVTSPGDPSTEGSVSFFDENHLLLGTATVVNGVATLDIGRLAPGQHIFSAVFTGGGGSQASGSSSLVSTTSGKVYLDRNASGSPDPGEPGMANRVVFVDLNHDGIYQEGEPIATTDVDGNFLLSGPSGSNGPILEATDRDTSNRHVVDQSRTNPDGSVSIGVVPISPVAPVPVVPDPFSTTPEADANAAFVRSLYKAVLGRAGSDPEVASWVAGMAGGVDRASVSHSFVNSPEHREQEVAAYYREFLHRAPDPTSIFWVNALQAGISEEKVVEAILNTPEYQTAHQDPALFVRDLYLDVLGRQGEGQGVGFWQSAMTAGASRASIVAAFVESGEAIEQMVDSFYVAFLHRQREPGTSNPWLDQLAKPEGSATGVEVGILSSPEFSLAARTPKA